MNINDDDILNLELYHDNKENYKLLEKCSYFFDTINIKKIYLSEKFNYIDINQNSCENLIKENLYKNLDYKNVILHKTYENEQNEVLNFDNVIFIFDNGALTNYGVEIIYNMFNIKSNTIKIFIPFVYICETKLNDKRKFIEIIKKIKNYQNIHDVKIYIENYFENNKLKPYFQDICTKC